MRCEVCQEPIGVDDNIGGFCPCCAVSERKRLEAENARLRAERDQWQTSTRAAWDQAHAAGKGEWGEFTGDDGRKWVVRYWADHLGWIVTCFRQDGDGSRKQCVWTNMPESVRALAAERLLIRMPECQVRTIPTLPAGKG